MRPVVYVSILLLFLVPVVVPSDNDLFDGNEELCQRPENAKECLEPLKDLDPNCAKWEKDQECLRDGECPEEFIAKSKLEFETKHNVNCDHKLEKSKPEDNDGDGSSVEKGMPLILLPLLFIVLFFK